VHGRKVQGEGGLAVGLNKNGSHFDLIGAVLEPFQLPFVQRGLIEILILAVPAGLLGTWIVLRGLAFFSHAVGTATFPGLVLADGLGFAAPLGAFGAAVVFSVGASLLTRGDEEGRDSAVAIVLVGCLAGGVILASDVFGSGANIETLLFGSLLLVDGGDIALAAVAAGVTLIASALLGGRWLAAGFDPGTAGSLRAGARSLDIALLGLIALATTAALSVIGALLVAALFVVPALTARLFTERMGTWQLAGVALVALEGTIGLWLSVKTDAPPGATIAVVAGAVFALAAGLRALARVPRAPALAVAGLIAATLLAAGCGSESGARDGQVAVVATTTQVGDFVREVGGRAVAVDQILQPNTDPHEYEPRPSDVADTAEATLVFASGDDLDAWIDQVVSDSGSDAQVVDLGAVVPERRPGESRSGEEASEYDPHWWHDPRNAEAAVGEIERQLIAASPAHRREFERNAAAYLAELRALDAGIARCIDSVSASRRKLVTDHDAFGYFADRYGIDVVGAVIPSQTTRAQPSAKDLSALADLIEREGVEAIFPESSLSPDVAEAIAEQTGASAEYSLYGDTLGPEGSAGATYVQMEAANASSMVRGFSGGAQGCNPSR
jgi:ABC-type Zn uptake system ZnuABC Zn-binding protein ZnuA/ABC-type Mn2+/Zn2+ transport system permease subunit